MLSSHLNTHFQQISRQFPIERGRQTFGWLNYHYFFFTEDRPSLNSTLLHFLNRYVLSSIKGSVLRPLLESSHFSPGLVSSFLPRSEDGCSGQGIFFFFPLSLLLTFQIPCVRTLKVKSASNVELQGV